MVTEEGELESPTQASAMVLLGITLSNLSCSHGMVHLQCKSNIGQSYGAVATITVSEICMRSTLDTQKCDGNIFYN